MATNIRTKIAITSFMRTIATRQLVVDVWVVGRQIADIDDTLHLRDVAITTIFWLFIYGVHIGTTWQIWLKGPCASAMQPDVKLLWPLVIITPHRSITYVDSACRYRWSSEVLSRVDAWLTKLDVYKNVLNFRQKAVKLIALRTCLVSSSVAQWWLVCQRCRDGPC